MSQFKIKYVFCCCCFSDSIKMYFNWNASYIEKTANILLQSERNWILAKKNYLSAFANMFPCLSQRNDHSQ